MFSDNIFNFTHFAMTIWGTAAAIPGLRMNDIFTDDGAKVLDNVFSNKCMHAATDTLDYAYSSGYKSFINPEPKNAVAWAQALIKGSVEPVRPMAPVVIYWGTKDTVVPPVMGRLYQEQMCGTRRKCPPSAIGRRADTLLDACRCSTVVSVLGQRPVRWKTNGRRLSLNAARQARQLLVKY